MSLGSQKDRSCRQAAASILGRGVKEQRVGLLAKISLSRSDVLSLQRWCVAGIHYHLGGNMEPPRRLVGMSVRAF